MSEISNILIGIIIAYACVSTFITCVAYISPGGTQIISNTELIQTLQQVVGTGESLYSNIETKIKELSQSSGSPADLIYIAFGVVITLLITSGQMILSILYLPILLIGFPFDILINILNTAPSDLSPILSIAKSFFNVAKTVVVIAFSLYLIFELIEYVGGRKP